jgi:hypothetical protein
VTSPGRGRFRAARGLVLSAACLLVPTTAHVMAGGGAPTTGPFLFGAALLSVASVGLAERRLGAGELAILMFASQPVLHVLLALSGHESTAISVDAGMVLAHALAAAVLSVLLAGAESVLWVMAALSSTLLLLPARAALLAPAVEVGGAGGPPQTPLRAASAYILNVTRTAPRRGPPVPAGT